MNTLVRPGEAIGQEATEIHGISNEMVASATGYATAAYTAHLLYREAKPVYLVTFNGLTFDEPVLDRCLGSKVFPGAKHIDVLNLFYRYWPTLPGYRLGLLYEQFMGQPLANAHDATIDVGATLDLLFQASEMLGKDLATLHAELLIPTPYSVLPISKNHRGKPIQEVPKSWAVWMKKNATGMRPDLAATVDWIIAYNESAR